LRNDYKTHAFAIFALVVFQQRLCNYIGFEECCRICNEMSERKLDFFCYVQLLCAVAAGGTNAADSNSHILL
jgi:uncharacterized protein with von Willebrand factor type A (vWA) domain